TMPRMVTISSRIGEEIFFAVDDDEVVGAAVVVAIEHHEAGLAMAIPAILPIGSCTKRSRSSGCLSGQSIVMMNSAFEAILPSLSSGEMASKAKKKRKATACSALNNIMLNGSKGSSLG